MFYIHYEYYDEFGVKIEGLFFTTNETVAKEKARSFVKQFADEQKFSVFIEKRT